MAERDLQRKQVSCLFWQIAVCVPYMAELWGHVVFLTEPRLDHHNGPGLSHYSSYLILNPGPAMDKICYVG